MLKIFEKKVRTSLPAVYRSKENDALVLFLKPHSGVCLNGVYLSGFCEPGLNCISNLGWERVKVRIEHLPLAEGYAFPNVLRSKADGRIVLFLSDHRAFELDWGSCNIRWFGGDWDYVDCVESGNWDLVDLTFE